MFHVWTLDMGSNTFEFVFKNFPKVFDFFKYFFKYIVSISISVSRSDVMPAKLITFTATSPYSANN